MIKNYIIQKITLCTLIIFVLSGCSLQSYAPKRIKNYVIQVSLKKATTDDAGFLKNTASYSFYPGGNYTLKLGDSTRQNGDYSYRRTERNSGQIICSYNTPNGQFSYEIKITFVGPKMGIWEDTYHKYSGGDFSAETGTFTVVKAPSRLGHIEDSKDQ